MRLYFDVSQEEIDEAYANAQPVNRSRTCLFARILNNLLKAPVFVGTQLARLEVDGRYLLDSIILPTKVQDAIERFDFSIQPNALLKKLEPDTYELDIPDSWEPYVTKK